MSNDSSLASERPAVKRKRLPLEVLRAIAAAIARNWRRGAEISARIERHRADVARRHARVRSRR